MNGLLNSIPLYQYSLAKAKQELAKSSVPNGFTTTYLMAVHRDDPLYSLEETES